MLHRVAQRLTIYYSKKLSVVTKWQTVGVYYFIFDEKQFDYMIDKNPDFFAPAGAEVSIIPVMAGDVSSKMEDAAFAGIAQCRHLPGCDFSYYHRTRKVHAAD